MRYAGIRTRSHAMLLRLNSGGEVAGCAGTIGGKTNVSQGSGSPPLT